MSDNICYVDAYARAIEARVLSVDSTDRSLVVLDRTVFYPGGGGQPSDRGLFLRAADGRKVGLDEVELAPPAGAGSRKRSPRFLPERLGRSVHRRLEGSPAETSRTPMPAFALSSTCVA